MRYVGGKVHSAADIAPRLRGGGVFVSPFCGGCAVEALIAESRRFRRVICSDIHRYLIAMYKALQGGWEPPSDISEERYRHIRDHKDDDPALAGFAGFACAFGASWFCGYAKAVNRNYAREGHDALMRDIKKLAGAEFLRADYREIDIPDGAVVYCDPPYAGTARYKGIEAFDNAEFWVRAEQLVRRGCHVYVSEEHAPDGWVSVWSAEKVRTLNNAKPHVATENLYMHRDDTAIAEPVGETGEQVVLF